MYATGTFRGLISRWNLHRIGTQERPTSHCVAEHCNEEARATVRVKPSLTLPARQKKRALRLNPEHPKRQRLPSLPGRNQTWAWCEWLGLGHDLEDLLKFRQFAASFPFGATEAVHVAEASICRLLQGL